MPTEPWEKRWIWNEATGEWHGSWMLEQTTEDTMCWWTLGPRGAFVRANQRRYHYVKKDRPEGEAYVDIAMPTEEEKAAILAELGRYQRRLRTGDVAAVVVPQAGGGAGIGGPPARVGAGVGLDGGDGGRRPPAGGGVGGGDGVNQLPQRPYQPYRRRSRRYWTVRRAREQPAQTGGICCVFFGIFIKVYKSFAVLKTTFIS